MVAAIAQKHSYMVNVDLRVTTSGLTFTSTHAGRAEGIDLYLENNSKAEK